MLHSARSARPFALLLAVLTCGCQSSGPEDGRAYCDEIVAMAKERIPACQGGDPARLSGYYEQVLGNVCDTLGASLSAGRVRFDADRAEDCTTFYSNATCTTLQPERSPCTDVYVGLVAAGGACVTSQDCAAGGLCDAQPGTCGATCTTRRQIGESCASTSGMLCVSGAACTQGKCVAQVRSVQGGACSNDYDCRSGVFGNVLYCAIPAGAKDGTCQPTKSGGPCAGRRECESKLYCASASDTCLARVRSGGACTPGDNACEPGTACVAMAGTTNGTCVEVPRPDGASCGYTGGEYVLCSGWCDAVDFQTSGTCRPKKKDGEACKSASECTGRCDKSGKCAPACPK
jgi:hypothetical protein